MTEPTPLRPAGRTPRLVRTRPPEEVTFETQTFLVDRWCPFGIPLLDEGLARAFFGMWRRRFPQMRLRLVKTVTVVMDDAAPEVVNDG